MAGRDPARHSDLHALPQLDSASLQTNNATMKCFDLFSSLLLPIWDFPKTSLNARIRHDIIIKNTGSRSAGKQGMDFPFDKQLRLGE
jgi:hypothetical protein